MHCVDKNKKKKKDEVDKWIIRTLDKHIQVCLLSQATVSLLPPLASPPPALPLFPPVRGVICLAAAPLANSNPFLVPSCALVLVIRRTQTQNKPCVLYTGHGANDAGFGCA